MQGDWRGYMLTAREMTLALDLTYEILMGHVASQLTEEQIDQGLMSLLEKGLIQPVEETARLDSMLEFVLRNYLAAKKWMRIYDRKSEIRIAEGEHMWIAAIRRRDQWQVVPLEKAEQALEEALDYASWTRGHSFILWGDREHQVKAVRVGEDWEGRVRQVWQDMTGEEKK